jgi:ABC-type transport system substrate-binding protein
MRGYRSKILPGILVVLIFCTNIVSIQPKKTEATTYYFTLEGLVSGGGTRVDAFYLMREQLARAGILLSIRNVDWSTYVGEIIAFYNFDITLLGLSGGGKDPDFTGVYNENGSLNLFGYHTSMDWDEDLGTGKNEWYMNEGLQITPKNSEERIQHYWAWQDYLMDKICPILPTFSPRLYNAYWANLNGYNMSNGGILQSWGKMTWTGLHTGQESVNELVISDAEWSNLNPLFQDDTSSSFISSACMDPLIWYDEDLSVHPHLAESITYINDTHIRIKIREGIKWASDPDGNFTNEYLDVDDVYFTLYCWDNFFSVNYYMWIEDMIKIDDYTLDIFIDGDRYTPGNQIYSNYLTYLDIEILPEHYLNQTQMVDEFPDITHLSWQKFAKHCFGTGLFEISDYVEGVETILILKTDCWRLNTTLTSDPALDWLNRFGDFSSGLNQLRIRVIPDLYSSLLELEAGKIDMDSISWNSEKKSEFQANPDFKLQSDVSYTFSFVGFNMRENRYLIGSRDPCPNDPTITIGLAIRKAICYAINRVEINNLLHYGEYEIYHSPMYPKMGIWVNPNIIKYNHDLCKSRDYLFKAGYGLVGCNPTIGINNGIYSLTTISLLAVVFFIYRKKQKK